LREANNVILPFLSVLIPSDKGAWYQCRTGKTISCFASIENDIKASGCFRHGAVFAEQKQSNSDLPNGELKYVATEAYQALLMRFDASNTLSCGGGEIRTHGTFPYGAFQVRWNKPLSDTSEDTILDFWEKCQFFIYTVCMKYLGIDYGTKRVGVALSDDSATLARPVAVLKNTPSLVSELEDIIAREEVGGIVIGSSEGNKVERAIMELVGVLTLATMLPVETMNEAFSSVEAHGSKGKERMHARSTKAPEKPDDLDARAAAVILQRHLDKVSRKK
jgi:putative Holliday junction resolvase